MNALLTPSTRQIAAQVAAILRHDPEAAVVGIRSRERDNWPAGVSVGERDFILAWCPSPLAVREQLVGTAADGVGRVILTPVDDATLGSDVLARLSRGRVFAVESWEMLRHAFQAREIDARLARWPWVAESLLENMPLSGYDPAPGGFLDADYAWSQVLRTVLRLACHSSRPDLGSLLHWSLTPSQVRSYTELPEAPRKQVAEWLIDVLGASGKLFMQCLEAGYGTELMPLALVCGMLFGDLKPESRARPELLAAAVRLERFTGGIPVRAEDGLRLYRAAVPLLNGLESPAAVLEAGDRLVHTLHLLPFADLSRDLPAGFQARLMLFSAAVDAFLSAPTAQNVAAVLAAGKIALAHGLARQQANRSLRVNMAMRLVRWLDTAPAASQGLGAAARQFSEVGAFVDWARLSLMGGDELAGLSRSYGALRDKVRVRREALNRDFADGLVAWNAAACPPLDGILPVERIIAEVLAPLAEKLPVLLLVLDGLSYPIFRELLEDAGKHGWNEVLSAEKPSLGLATIPSITEISRASLLCGRLMAGQQAQEKSGFAQHPALAALARAKPLLFHKGELSDGVGLSDEVRNAIGDPKKKVVGVVYNGVDDHLSGADQLQPRWSLDDLRLIKPLLFEARLAGRVVVVSSDHGHVIEESSHLVAAGDGDRWRAAVASPGAEERLLENGRVLTIDGKQRVVVPWSESLRYAGKRNGYHGGISLQEMVVPVAILTSGLQVPEGYHLAPLCQPEWWDVTTPAMAALPIPAPLKPAPRKTRTSALPDAHQGGLFADLPTAAPAQAQQTDWIGAILATSVYAAQKQWAARAGLKDEEVRRLLEALAERGGKLSKSALASRLALPLMRVSGFVNAARRLLNVDQAPVLLLDEGEGLVSLNRELLEAQFREPGQ